MTKVIYNDQPIDFDATRMIMDDDICEAIHGTVDTDQEFMDAYSEAHHDKYGVEFVLN